MAAMGDEDAVRARRMAFVKKRRVPKAAEVTHNEMIPRRCVDGKSVEERRRAFTLIIDSSVDTCVQLRSLLEEIAGAAKLGAYLSPSACLVSDVPVVCHGARSETGKLEFVIPSRSTIIKVSPGVVQVRFSDGSKDVRIQLEGQRRDRVYRLLNPGDLRPSGRRAGGRLYGPSPLIDGPHTMH